MSKDNTHKDDNESFHVETSGEIGEVDVTIRCEGEEKLAEFIHMDLVNRADEIRQIVELDRHPEAVDVQTKIDWVGWQNGEYSNDD